RFVAGTTVDDVVRAAADLNRNGFSFSVDYLGESVRSPEEARAAAGVYRAVLARIAGAGLDGNVSLKLTQMGQDVGEEFLRQNVGRVLDRAAELGIFIRFDMESGAYTQRTLDFFRRVWDDGYHNVGAVIQSYLYRSERDVHSLNGLGARVRLCKGAYNEPESVAFPEKAQVDANFVRLMKLLLADGRYPGIATHDEKMIRATQQFARQRQIPSSAFEFQMLYGVRRDLQERLVREGHNVRIYVPFGEAWYPYFMRRMAERPANLFFVVNAVVRESPLRVLLPRGNARH
ncbi:MAG: proline dehydrogenase family protein, partial [Gemmatimonadetes bacterium]|nr:proline dehydrogenase family protein [Gemmatimonadota bacterium]